jgi:hypothetical protein
MKPALRVVLDFLISKGGLAERGCWWRQKRMRDELGIPHRSLQRYLSQLEKLGELRVEHRSSTTNLYFVVENAVGNQSNPHAKMAAPHAKLAHASIEVNLNTERKPAARETRSAEMPAYQIAYEGRMVINPEYQRVREALALADGRIRRARNPEAYARAIIARERGVA